MRMSSVRFLTAGVCLAIFRLLGTAFPASASVSAECVVQCAGGDCGVNGADPLPGISTIQSCATATMTHGKVVGAFQTPRGLQRFAITERLTPFVKLVPALATANCALGGSCLEERDMQRAAAIGGKGADEDRVVREGRPCELGLPCGQILKPKQTLQIRTVGVDEGKLVLAGKRGADKTPMSFDLHAGRIEFAADKLVPSGVYTYALLGPTGASIARGEFSVMSTKMQRDVESGIADERRDHPDEATLREIEILLEEDLQWNAAQLIH